MAEVLVIGYGNSLRSDDAAGPRVAAAVEDWALPGVRAIAAQQLTPELTDPVSAAHLVIFVDARHAHAGDPVRVQPIEPRPIGSACLHACDPHWLLACAQAVFGSRPRAWLITVPATNFAVGEALSPTARDGFVAALLALAALLSSALSSVGSGAPNTSSGGPGHRDRARRAPRPGDVMQPARDPAHPRHAERGTTPADLLTGKGDVGG